MKTKIYSLAGVISDSRCASVDASHVRLGRRRSNTAKIVAINQISIVILSEGKHKLRRRSSRHIDQRSTNTAQIGVATVKRLPISRRPIVSGLTAKDRPGLQTDNCLTAAPDIRIKRVTSNHEHVCAIASHTAMPPDATADCCGSTSQDVGRIVDVNADNPAVIHTAVTQ